MFAGPNGSGKSSLKQLLPAELQGVYLNPDEIEAILRESGGIDLGDFSLKEDLPLVLESLQKIERPGFSDFADKLLPGPAPGLLRVEPAFVNSYLASALVESIREVLMERGTSLTFETAMSHPSKVKVLRRARDLGYRTYLYYVATEDVEINISRVANRVALGGHPVPENRIRSRYDRSLGLLFDAILISHRAYLFDNSQDGSERSWIAEVTNGEELELKVSEVPYWFKVAVLDKIRGQDLS